MSNRKYRLYLSFLCTILFELSFAQIMIPLDTTKHPVHITQYDVSKGMLQNSVRSLGKDNANFIWIVSEKGLSRFDGSSFRHYSKQFSYQKFNTLFKINNKLYTNGVKHAMLKNGQVDTLQGIPQENSSIDLVGQAISTLNYKYYNQQIKPDLKTTHHKFIRINDSSIFKYDNESKTLNYFVNQQKQGDILKHFDLDDRGKPMHQIVLKVFVYREALYYLSSNNDILVFKKGELTTKYSLPKGLENLRIIRNLEDEIYFTSDNILYELILEPKQEKIKKIVQIDQGPIRQVLKYDNDILFIGTGNAGLYKIKRKYFTPLYLASATNLNYCRSVFEVGLDSVITEKGLLFHAGKGINLNGKINLTYLKDSVQNLNLQLKSKRSFFDKFTMVPKPKVINGIGNFIKDRDDNIWFGGINGVALIEADTGYQYLDSISSNLGSPNGSFYNPFTHEIWLLFRTGVRIFSIREKSFRSVGAFQNLDIRSIYVAKDGILWLCIHGHGISIWDGKILTIFPLDKIKALLYPHQFVEDKKGFFWISTDNGLFKVSKKDLEYYVKHPDHIVYYHRFDKSDGFMSDEFNGRGTPSGIQLSSEKIAFASLIGTVLFDPNLVQTPPCNSNIFLDKVELDGKDTILSLSKGLSQDFEFLKFNVHFPYYGNSNNIPIQYKVEGLHQDWHSLSSEKTILLSRLPHGNYTLKIKRKNGFEINNYTAFAYAFKVNPFFYQTQTFKVLLIIILLFLIGGLLILNSWIGKLKRIRLEKIIQEKTHDQIVLNEELKLNLAIVHQSEMELKENANMKNKFMAIYTHDVRGPLRFIRTITSSSIKGIHKIDKTELAERLEDIQTSTHQVYLRTEHMFHWLRSQKEEFELKEEKFNLQKLLDFVVTQYYKQAESKDIVINMSVDKDLQISSEKNVLTIVLSNIIDNAIKFTFDGNITIHVFKLKDHLVINIKDTGVGINKQKLQEMRDGVFSSDDGTGGERGTGFGLKTIKELLIMINGYMEIESEENKGTSVSIFLNHN